MDPHEIGIDESEQETCRVCGLIAVIKTNWKISIKHAHTQGDSNEVVSPEQNIDPFIKTK